MSVVERIETSQALSRSARKPAGLAEALNRSGWLCAVAIAALVIGLSVYWVDRQPRFGSLVPAAGWLQGMAGFGSASGWLPTFSHAFAFSLFTAALLTDRNARYIGCFMWLSINVGFEIGQHPAVGLKLAAVLHDAPISAPFAHWLANYFVYGMFDLNDILAALLGATAAFAFLTLFQPVPEESHVQ